MRHQHRPSLLQIVACRLFGAPRHCLNKCCIIVNATLRNKLQLNGIRNSNIFNQENVFENFDRKLLAILFGPQYVNRYHYLTCAPAVATRSGQGHPCGGVTRTERGKKGRCLKPNFVLVISVYINCHVTNVVLHSNVLQICWILMVYFV